MSSVFLRYGDTRYKIFFRHYYLVSSIYCILYLLFLQLHQRVEKLLQVLFAVEFQLEAALFLAVDDFYAPAQMLALALFTLGNIVHVENFRFFRGRGLAHVLAQGFRLTHGQ